MAEAKKREDWERTSWLLAKIHNVNTTGKAKHPDDFNPMKPRVIRSPKKSFTISDPKLVAAVLGGEVGTVE